MSSEENTEDEVKKLREQVQELQALREKQEREFGEGRAKLKQLYLQKEEEVRLLGIELEEANSRVVIAECTAENRVEAEQRKCREELATVQQLCREEAEAAIVEERERAVAEIQSLRKLNAKLENDKKRYKHLYQQTKDEATAAQNNSSSSRAGGTQSPPSLLSPAVFTGLTKSIAKHVPGLTTTTSSSSPGGGAAGAPSSATAPAALQQITAPTMSGVVNPGFSDVGSDESRSPHSAAAPGGVSSDAKVLSEEAGVLQERVAGLEEEVRVLRERLQQYQQTESSNDEAAIKAAAAAAASSADELSSLAAEKSSRADLELYTSILNAQKTALSNQLTAIRADSEKWRKLYESEHGSLNELRGTWQRANDHFLSSQQHSLALTRRLRGLLTEEQLEQLSKMSDKDEEEDIEDIWSGSEDELRSPQGIQDPSIRSLHSSAALTTPTAATTIVPLLSPDEANEEENILEEVMLPAQDSHSRSKGLSTRFSPEKLPQLTEDQRRALLQRDTTDDANDEEARRIAGGAVSPPSAGGSRMVSEYSWRRLQRDLRNTKAKLAKPCEGCLNSQQQLRELKAKIETLNESKALLQAAVERQIKELEREAEYRRESEETWLKQVEEYQQKEVEWSQQLDKASRLHHQFMSRWRDATGAIQTKMAQLTGDRASLQQIIQKLQHENDMLAGKHLKSARELQEKAIDLPANIDEDTQLQFLQLQEEVITARVAKESSEENLNGTIALLQSQLIQEEAQRRRLEETLGRENRELRDMVGRLQEAASQEQVTEEQHQQAQQQKQHDQQMMTELKKQLNDMLKMKRDLEAEVAEQKQRVASLQHDLDLSEQTQRDFVRLSQSLQVQLEKFRQSDSEVRWQHEDDVTDCSNCKERFTAYRRKHHCKHCGKIFCGECANKTVTAGPNNRVSRVCDVCHTLLVPHAKPYFSTANDAPAV